MTTKELTDMPKALRLLAAQIKSPDYVPAMCLRDAAAMIESLTLKLTEAQKLLTMIEAGSCDHPGYEAGTWLRIYGQNAEPIRGSERNENHER